MPPKKVRTDNADPTSDNLTKSSAKKNVFERDSKLPNTPNALFEELLKPHVESFDEFLENVNNILPFMEPVSIKLNERDVKLSIRDIQIGKPFDYKRNAPIVPHECREGNMTYAAKWNVTIAMSIGDEESQFTLELNNFPIMLRSQNCNLAGKSPVDLVKLKEEPWEAGGYFILNGKERCLRIQVVQRRNHAVALQKNFPGLSSEYSDMAFNVRSIRADHTGVPMYIHYMRNGAVDVRFWIGKQAYFLPAGLLLKAMGGMSDKAIYERIVHGNNFYKNMDIAEEVQTMIQMGKTFTDENNKLMYLDTKKQALQYLGNNLRIPLRAPDTMTDEDAGVLLIKKCILVNLDNMDDKFEFMIFMMQKLYALAKKKIQPENMDSMIHHEALLPGHVMQMMLKRKLESALLATAADLNKTFTLRTAKLKNPENAIPSITKSVANARFDAVAKGLGSFLATGNFGESFSVGLRETSGYSIIPERINHYRFMANFRSVHRGSSFQEQRITSTRKLLPETWGFLCPVHTPDGGPCGLLNHMATPCKIVARKSDTSNLKAFLCSIGMESIFESGKGSSDHLTVILDGQVIGKIPVQLATNISDQLRTLKMNGSSLIPPTIEIALIKPSTYGLYPGLYLYNDMARFIRPIKHLKSGKTEFIGPLEQIYMNIAVTDVDIRDNTTHIEISPMNMFSFLADLTPFSDFNQSPRNMYQCQMGKQTMGTPFYAYGHRVEKSYRLQTPQKPLVKTTAYDAYDMDQYPAGTNACVAVISYTGYDMEDGMIINKSSYERGFAHGTLYKMYDINLIPKTTQRNSGGPTSFIKNTDEFGKVFNEALDRDGLPHVGTLVRKGDPLYCTLEPDGHFNIHAWKTNEDGYIDQVRILDTDKEGRGITYATIKIRFNRNPVIGDKFSSRHGQKGTLSRLWPQIDMPFSESGITPDVIINPNAFPSRMTIGMLVESMAGKSGSLHAIYQDGSPFQFNEQNTAVKHFGDQLVKAGYNYFGNEPMYSGTTGQIFNADIYLGVVYYQRLRHMVKDKFQARSSGPINRLTKQPLKGRKIGGGIRFGEMERDSLLGHGASFLLQDRLVNCSDEHKCHVCSSCGSLVSPIYFNKNVSCLLCGNGKGIKVISLPFVVRYLAAELLAVNVKLNVVLNE